MTARDDLDLALAEARDRWLHAAWGDDAVAMIAADRDIAEVQRRMAALKPRRA